MGLCECFAHSDRANWTAARIQAFKRYLNGDTNAKFRGQKPNGDMYKKELSVRTLVAYYEPMKFSVRKGKLFVTGGDTGTREVITDEQVASKAKKLYQHKETGLGKAPSIYNFMKTKYANVGYKKVERAIQSLASYQKYQARHVRKPKVRKVIVSGSPGESIDADVMFWRQTLFWHDQIFTTLGLFLHTVFLSLVRAFHSFRRLVWFSLPWSHQCTVLPQHKSLSEPSELVVRTSRACEIKGWSLVQSPRHFISI